VRDHHDLTQAVLQKMTECPRCKAKLRQTTERTIRCDTCGFRIRTSSWHEDLYSDLVLLGIMLLGIGFIVGSEWMRFLLTR